MEFQDEVDRHQTSLFAAQTYPEEDLARGDLLSLLKKKENKSGIELDQSCMSCSLEKYRPFIKNAFKIACIQYKPSEVRLNDAHYSRVNLLNAKRNFIEEIC